MKHILFCLFVCLHIVAHSADPGDGQNMLQRKKVGANGFEQEVWTWSNGTLIGRLSNGSIGSISMGNGVSLSAEGVLSATAGITSMGLSVPSGLSVTGSPLTNSGTITITTALSGILKGTGSGFEAATAGVDFLVPSGSGAALTGITAGQISGLGTLATQSGTFSGTSSGTNTGDNAVNSLYSGLVSNATHTGDATGATALTVVGINGTILSTLGTGILKNTTGTGVPSIAVAGDFPILNQNTTGNASTATTLATARTIGGTSFDGSANIVPATITVADTVDTDAFIAIFESATGDLYPKTDGALTYNAGTGTLSATAFAGAGGGLTLDASGFNGNLATTDNTLQEVAQKLDDLTAGGVGGSTGSIDNSVLRANGTGGSSVQSSNIAVSDASTATARNVTIWNNHPADASYSVTGVASTNVITAPGHNFVLYDAVTFPSLTGGAGLQPEPATYYVRDVSGNTFKLSYTDGSAVIDFTTDISAGTVELARSALVLTPKGTGALIAGYPPDGTELGGNARGRWAIDLQLNRASADQVASGQACVAIGIANKAGYSSASQASVCIGNRNTALNNWSVGIGYNNNLGGGNGSVGIGYSNLAPSIGGGNVFLGYQNGVDTDRPSYNNWGSILATGSTAAVRREGVVVHSFGSWGYLKPAQHEKTGLMVETSGATPTTMTTSNGYRFNLDSDCVYDCDIKITARSAAGVSASFHRRCLIERTGNTTALVGAVQTVNTDILEDGVTWSVSITADDTNDCLKIEVTGQAATAIRWMAVIEDNELNY